MLASHVFFWAQGICNIGSMGVPKPEEPQP